MFLLLASVTGGVVHSWVERMRGRRRVVQLLLVYLLVGYYGIGMALSGVVHLAHPRELAALKGWPVSEPMHRLYAFALFGLALTAILAIRLRGTYLLAPAISGSVLALGGAYVHGMEIAARGSVILARDGVELLFDLVVPVSILTLAGVDALDRCHRGAAGEGP